jgi:taurine dioxygenase
MNIAARAPKAGYDLIQVEKLTPNIGAEVFGVDLTRPLPAEALVEVRRAFTENGVIFFRDQTLSIAQHMAFAANWGDLFVHPASKPVEGYKELIRIYADENSKKVAGEAWHTDTSCEASPPLGSMLHMHVVPETGGDTLFASMYAAYDALSPSMKTLLEGKTAHHSGTLAYRGYYENQDKKYPNADHPVICVHPDSGRKLLFVNRFYTTRINELPESESDDILRLLLRHIEQPEFQCRFRWKPNSIAFWDNRCTQHKAIFDYFPNRRMGYRVQIQGKPPIAA